VYSAKIDITIKEWKNMLLDENIFNRESLDMVVKWYAQINHQATTKEIMNIYSDEYINHKSPPFNGIVVGLATRVIKHLKRFEVLGIHSGKSHFIIPFEGWHENYKQSNAFVWKLRDELAESLEELGLVKDFEVLSDTVLESVVYNKNYMEGKSEGKKIEYYTTKYERSPINRGNAIKIHGSLCCICEFDFENTYGELGINYVEVHHLKPLSSRNEIIVVNPETDLVCVCANCHRMLHRKKDRVLSPNELKSIITANKNKR
jgi:5-methylcytosine-specific restriction enzyme A